MQTSRTWKRAALAVAALAIAAPAASPAHSGSHTVTPNTLVNSDLVTNPNRMHDNTGVAVSPLNADVIVSTSRLRPDVAPPAGQPAPQTQCVRHRSIDGGATWQTLQLDYPTGATGYRSCNPGNLKFDDNGSLYIAGILGTTNNTGSAVAVWRSTDAGATFGMPSIAQPVDPGLAGTTAAAMRVTSVLPFVVPDPYSDAVYLSYTRCEQTGTSACRPAFRSSADGGLTWTSHVLMAPANVFTTAPGALHVTFDVAPGGKIFSSFWDSKSGSATAGVLLFARSLDGGQTFSTHLVSASVDYPVRSRIGVDKTTGTVHLAYEDQKPPELTQRLGPAQPTVVFPAPRTIWYTRSLDGGETWAPERPLHSDSLAARRDHFRPVLNVAPNGRVDVYWYDSRFSEITDPANPSYNRYLDVVYTWSDDGGATFAPEVRISEQSVDSTVGVGGAGLFFLYGASRDDAAYIIWTDTRNAGAAQPHANDVYFSKVLHS